MNSLAHPLRGFARWMHNQLVQPVDESSALCEFDCRNNECTFGEWAACERRLRRAEGELMPESSDSKQS